MLSRARIVLPPSKPRLLWSIGEGPFNGYAVFDVVLHHNYWAPDLPDRVTARSHKNDRVPHRVVIPVKDGLFPDEESLPLTTEYGPGARYVLHYHDDSMGLVSGPTTLFTVESSPFLLDFPAITLPNIVSWPLNPFTYTILFIDQANGDNSNPPTGPAEAGQYLRPWRTPHNLEWFQPNANNAVLLRRDQSSPWVDITYQFPWFTEEHPL